MISSKFDPFLHVMFLLKFNQIKNIAIIIVLKQISSSEIDTACDTPLRSNT